MREGVHLSSESADPLAAEECTAPFGQQVALPHLLPENRIQIKDNSEK